MGFCVDCLMTIHLISVLSCKLTTAGFPSENFWVDVVDLCGNNIREHFNVVWIQCPCPDDPVLNPRIAPTWVPNGTYDTQRGLLGCTRIARNNINECSANCLDGTSSKPHYEIDISPDNLPEDQILNSPVFNMYEGVIELLSENCQPNECNSTNINGCGENGNWIVIRSTINNREIHIRYGHLNEIFLKELKLGKKSERVKFWG